MIVKDHRRFARFSTNVNGTFPGVLVDKASGLPQEKMRIKGKEIKAVKDAIEHNNPRQKTNAARYCHECSEEAFGRCPDCHMGFCQEHFPKQQHSLCAEKQMQLAHTQTCYVCGTQVYPDQWSFSKTSHYIDHATCQGCGCYICNDLHTRHKTEEVVIIREGLRGHRYQYIMRYCDLCTPLSSQGGIRGLARYIVVVGTIAAAIFFYLHP